MTPHPLPPPLLTPASCFGFENMKLAWLDDGEFEPEVSGLSTGIHVSPL